MTKYVYVFKDKHIIGYDDGFYNRSLRGVDEPYAKGHIIKTDSIKGFPHSGYVVRAYGFHPYGLADFEPDYKSDKTKFEVWARNKDDKWVFARYSKAITERFSFREYFILEKAVSDNILLGPKDILDWVNQPTDTKIQNTLGV